MNSSAIAFPSNRTNSPVLKPGKDEWCLTVGFYFKSVV